MSCFSRNPVHVLRQCRINHNLRFCNSTAKRIRSSDFCNGNDQIRFFASIFTSRNWHHYHTRYHFRIFHSCSITMNIMPSLLLFISPAPTLPIMIYRQSFFHWLFFRKFIKPNIFLLPCFQHASITEILRFVTASFHTLFIIQMPLAFSQSFIIMPWEVFKGVRFFVALRFEISSLFVFKAFLSF